MPKSAPDEPYPSQEFRKAHIAQRNRGVVRAGSLPRYGWFEELMQAVGLEALEDLDLDEIELERYKRIGMDVQDPMRPEHLLKSCYMMLLKSFASRLGEVSTATDAAQKGELTSLVRASEKYETALRELSDASEKRIRAADPEAFPRLSDCDQGRDLMLLANIVCKNAEAARAALAAMESPKGTRPPAQTLRRDLIERLGFVFDFFYTLIISPEHWEDDCERHHRDFVDRHDDRKREMEGNGNLPSEIAEYRAIFVSEILRRHEDPTQKEYVFAPIPPKTFRGKADVLNVLGGTWKPLEPMK